MTKFFRDPETGQFTMINTAGETLIFASESEFWKCSLAVVLQHAEEISQGLGNLITLLDPQARVAADNRVSEIEVWPS